MKISIKNISDKNQRIALIPRSSTATVVLGDEVTNPTLGVDFDGAFYACLTPKEVPIEPTDPEIPEDFESDYQPMIVKNFMSQTVSIGSTSRLHIDWGPNVLGVDTDIFEGSGWTYHMFQAVYSPYDTSSAEIKIWHADGVSQIKDLQLGYIQEVKQWYGGGYNRFGNIDTGVPKGIGAYVNKVPNVVPPNTTNIDWMFSDNYGQGLNISEWDVSNIRSMTGLLASSYYFNSDLSNWCVSYFTSAPLYFFMSSGLAEDASKHPKWGTCPTRPEIPTDPTEPPSESEYMVVSDASSAGGGVTFIASNELEIDWGAGYTNPYHTTIEDTSGLKHYYVAYYDSSLATQAITKVKAKDGGKIKNLYMMGPKNIEAWYEGGYDGFGETGDNYVGLGPYLVEVPSYAPPNTTNYSYMFAGCYYMNSANVPLWDVSEVTNMTGMFYSSYGFNKNLKNWCVQNVTSLPDNFGANVLPVNYFPVWGTCPVVTEPENPTEGGPYDEISFSLAPGSVKTLYIGFLYSEASNENMPGQLGVSLADNGLYETIDYPFFISALEAELPFFEMASVNVIQDGTEVGVSDSGWMTYIVSVANNYDATVYYRIKSADSSILKFKV